MPRSRALSQSLVHQGGVLGLDVDKCPREDTRKSQSLVHQNGVLGVLGKIREKPHVSLNPLGRRARDARKAACKDPEYA